MQYYSIIDFIYGPVALFLIIVFARTRKSRLISTRPEYKYFTKGLYAKIVGGIGFLLVYTLYYGGGDTTSYFHDGVCMVRLLLENPTGYFTIMRDGLNISNYFYFNDQTGYPMYWRDDAPTFNVVKLATPFVFISGGSIVVTTLLFATVSFAGMWQLYKLFISEFPELKKEMAIALLFIPSVFFWGSGIMKDTITLSCVGFYSFAFYKAFIKKQKILQNLIVIFISVFLILKIKPYIVFALLPGSFIWWVNNMTGAIENRMIKFIIGPFMLVIATLGAYFMLAIMGEALGSYSVDKVLEKAVVTNQDLKSEHYSGNSFDIGDFEPTIPSMLAKAPAAINVSLFRPYLWEARNIVMVLSGLEGFFILYFTLKVLFRIRIFGFIKYLNKNHLLVFSLIFSLFFAFSVGISTSNFGSLVRYRIPVLPFFVASLFIIEYFHKKAQKEAEAKRNLYW